LPEDPIVDAFAEMIISLMAIVRDKHPSASEFITLSRPDIDSGSAPHHGRFTLAIQKAGLKDFGSTHDPIASLSALWSFGMLDCTDELCEGEPRVLVLHYTASTLSVSSMNSGVFYYSCRVRNFPNLGAESMFKLKEPTEYWSKVKSAVQNAFPPRCDRTDPSKPTHIEQIIVLGEHGNDTDFLRILQDIHGSMPRIRSLSAADHLFAAARGAAMQARTGMVDGYNECVSNGWCAQAPEDKNIIIYPPTYDGEKEEL
jgi:hypothetical protein